MNALKSYQSFEYLELQSADSWSMDWPIVHRSGFGTLGRGSTFSPSMPPSLRAAKPNTGENWSHDLCNMCHKYICYTTCRRHPWIYCAKDIHPLIVSSCCACCNYCNRVLWQSQHQIRGVQSCGAICHCQVQPIQCTTITCMNSTKNEDVAMCLL